MRIHDARSPAPPDLRGASAALGNLDGVHLGHQAVIAAAKAWGAAPLAAIVFEPHPREVFRPDGPPFLLQSFAQRGRALAGAGVETTLQVTFDRVLASLTDAEFAKAVLVESLGVAHVAVGRDFCFGRGRMGDSASLTRLGAEIGFAVSIVDAVDDSAHAGEKVSSSLVRDAVRDGDVMEAARLMGRAFAIEGVVIDGAKRGRTVGFPTANIALGRYVRPKFGVYAVRVDVGDGVWRAGVANLGVKPTVGSEEPLLEAHVFDFDGDLYGRVIEVRLERFLREERRFEGFEALLSQIRKDAAAARALLE